MILYLIVLLLAKQYFIAINNISSSKLIAIRKIMKLIIQSLSLRTI